MHRRLSTDHSINVPHDVVRLIIGQLDPEGVNSRSRRVLRRRMYSARGPNYVWHVDGNDKLLPYGFAIHGAIDGYSRRIIWLEVSPTNKKPEVVAGYFVDSLRKLVGAPLYMRFDDGTENGLMADLHMLLTNGLGTPIFGRSTANQRIEAWWNILKKNTLHEYISFFRDMIDQGMYDTSDDLHREAIRYFFGSIITSNLAKVARDWNNHRIRPVANSDCPAGKPNVMYYVPPPDAEECKLDIDIDMLDDVQETIIHRVPMFDENIAELVKIVMGDITLPSTKEAAKDLYIEFLDQLDNLIG